LFRITVAGELAKIAMPLDTDIQRLLAEYGLTCHSDRVESLRGAGGFSGAQFWRISTPETAWCLRRWPTEHPTAEQLEFIHAVLFHVAKQGVRFLPVPRLTKDGGSYLCYEGHLWELAPWLAGKADFRAAPSRVKLRAALQALAQFHQAAASFPLAPPRSAPSPGLVRRIAMLRRWRSGDAAALAATISPTCWPELYSRSQRILDRFAAGAATVAAMLEGLATVEVPLQPCIGDIWHPHVLFQGERVSGLIDFGSLRIDNVGTDIARLLGSLAGDDTGAWQEGLDAYGAIRPLSDIERTLLSAFDRSTVLMAGLNWLDWIYRQGRQFEDPQAVLARIDEINLRNLNRNG
jgi:homoserine kinase type II